MAAMWKKELKYYFLNPLGYVFMGIFLLMSGVFFALFNMNNASSDLDVLFGNMIYLFMILTPILTMRLLSEERKSKSDQLLMTSPMPVWKIAAGKYAAALTVLTLTLLCTLPYVVIIGIYAQLYPGLILSNYLGFFLMGCSYIAIGLLMSALTESQLSAAVLTMAAILLLQVLEAIGPTLNFPYLTWLQTLIGWGSLYTRYDLFAAGIISPANIIYYVSFCGVLLFVTVQMIDRRRWREG